MKEIKILMLFILTIFATLGLSACGDRRVVLPTDTPEGADAALEAAVRELGRQLGIGEDAIKVVSVQAEEWPDSCLGAPTAEEKCAEVIIKGFGGILEVNGARYEFRTNERGDQVRIIPRAVQAAIQALGYKLGADVDTIHLVSYTPEEWRNSCLGVRVTKEVCLDVITPGYIVVLEANGGQYVYHTDEQGTNLALADFPLPGIGDTLIVWSEYDELGCQLALINLDEVSYGACEGTLETVPFPDEMDRNMLTKFVEKFAAFEAEAVGGKISLAGEGSVAASAEEQAMMAEWARLVKQAAESISGD